MVNRTKSVIVSDVKIKGNITEKESIIIDGEIDGNINAKLVETFENSLVKGNIRSKEAIISGKLKGNIDSDSVHIKKTALLLYFSMQNETYVDQPNPLSCYLYKWQFLNPQN